MTTELYKKHRPTTLDGVYGLGRQVENLRKLLANGFPHATLFTGPSGCGKTSLARILRRELKCSKQDYYEINIAQSRGIDTVREITENMHKAPWSGPCRVWYLDEVHAITGAGQEALLKILEDTPSHVYFLLATTEPQKLRRTVVTRCTEVRVDPLGTEDMCRLLTDVTTKEGKELLDAVMHKIVEVSEGSARQALKLLNQVIDLEDEDEQLSTVESSSGQAKGYSVAQILVDPKKGSWKEVVAAFKLIENDEIESARQGILGYAGKGLQDGWANAKRCLALIDLFSFTFFDSGRWGFLATCHKFYHGK